MALIFKWDQISQHKVRYTRRGLQITRGCLVTNIPITEDGTTGTDASVFIKVLVDANCPVLGSTYPTTSSPFNQAVLDEIAPGPPGNRSATQTRVDFIYVIALQDGTGAGGATLWTVTDAGTGSWVETFATADGSKALSTWYRKGAADAVAAPPAGTAARPTIIKPSRGVHKFVSGRAIRVSGLLLASDWNAVKDVVHAAAGKISSDTWGSYTRGKWLFLYATTTTSDFGKSFRVELFFQYDPKGHFPISAYFNEHGDRPADASKEGTFGTSLPALGGQLTANGLSKHSTQLETAFSSLFAFTP